MNAEGVAWVTGASRGLVNNAGLDAAYRASKAAAGALGESLRAEVAPFGIRVLEVMPGPIETEMLRASDRLPEAAGHEGYRELAEGCGAVGVGWRGSRLGAPSVGVSIPLPTTLRPIPVV